MTDTTGNGEAAGPPIERRIHEVYAQLPPSERKLADLVLQFPGDLAAYSATELSALADVSKAAATRFFRRLGFASYEEARRLARSGRESGSPVYMASAGTSDAGRPPDLAAFLADEQAAIERTLARIDPETLGRIAGSLATARRVFIVGLRNSYYLAGYLRALVGQARGDVMLVPAPGEAAGDRLAGLGGDDLVVVIAMRRRPALIGKLLEAMGERGVPVILVTDPTARGLPALARETVLCETETRFLFDSYAAAHSVLRLIAVETMRQLDRGGRAHLSAVEVLHQAFDELNR